MALACARLLASASQPVHAETERNYATIPSDGGGERVIKNSIIYNKEVRLASGPGGARSAVCDGLPTPTSLCPCR